MIKFHALASSSSGNSLLIEQDNTKILVDCGISCRRICNSLKILGVTPDEIDAVLLTHEHSDHIGGVRVFSKTWHTPLFASEGTLSFVESSDSDVTTVRSGTEFTVGDITVSPFEIPHDAKEPLGYMFMSEGKKFAVATDMGKIVTDIAYTLKGSDFVFIESNHDREMLINGQYPYPLKQRILGTNGHLSNEQCSKLVTALARSGTKSFMLGHLSVHNNTPEKAFEANLTALKNEGFSDVVLKVAKKDIISEEIVIGQ